MKNSHIGIIGAILNGILAVACVMYGYHSKEYSATMTTGSNPHTRIYPAIQKIEANGKLMKIWFANGQTDVIEFDGSTYIQISDTNPINQ
jgi:hypothetical protein